MARSSIYGSRGRAVVDGQYAVVGIQLLAVAQPIPLPYHHKGTIIFIFNLLKKSI